jgi:hypothetical protein
MKALKNVFPVLIVAGSLFTVFSGCYTQIVTDDEDRRYSSRHREYRDEDQDSVATRNDGGYYDDDNYRSRYTIGFRYYYPMWTSIWVHYDPWYYDPWYYDFYYYSPYYTPWICGSPYIVYHIPPYRYYGWYYPRYYYSYPYSGYYIRGTYASSTVTRNSGYRRTSGGTRDGGSGRTVTGGGYALDPNDSRGAAVRRESGTRSGSGTTARSSYPWYGKSGSGSQPSRGVSTGREAASSRPGGSRQHEYVPPRRDESSRTGGYTRGRDSSPPASYSPPSRSYSPPPQSAGGGSPGGGRSSDGGGNRSGGATRSGRN